ncbi:hypothetical protein U1Q18_030700 [Sarracenia purpurea var. burkii]
MHEVLEQISIHCKNFSGLEFTRANIREREVSAILTLFPHIKYLILRYGFMEKKNRVMILKGCKKLVQFDVRNCIGFVEGDDEILKFTSHIKTFEDEGSMMFDDDDDYFDHYYDDYDDYDDYSDYYYNDDDDYLGFRV